MPSSGSVFWLDANDNTFVNDPALYDLIQGYGGSDTISGGTGDQTIYGNGKPGQERAGDQGDFLYGEGGNDTLNGAEGDDSLFGGTGNDSLEGGDDSDRLMGDSGSDTLMGGSGNDVMDGGDDGDQMVGGTGNDQYFFDDAGDRIIESTTAAGGFDSILSLQTINLTNSAIFTGRIEAATVYGDANINLIGNIIRNTLTGNDGNNVLNGMAGADNMRGRGGSDTYVFDNAGDIADETLPGSFGFDRVLSSVTVNFSNTAQIKGALERIELTGTADINATGNLLANSIVGNAGNNTINGLNGNDILTGGAGTDAFVFSYALGAGNVDQITDYEITLDRFWLDEAIFSAFGAFGPISGSQFRIFGTGPQDANDFMLYNPANGAVYYDADAGGGAAAQLFAVVDPGMGLSAGDFVIV